MVQTDRSESTTSGTSSFYECVDCGLQIKGASNENSRQEELNALTRSNDPPSSFAHKTFQAEYIETSKALDSLESRIEKLSASLQSLQEMRDHLQETKGLYASILHPVRRLPVEILADIFRLCTQIEFGNLDDFPADMEGHFPGSLDTHKAPWVLGQICRRWRMVALTSTDLWTRIDLSWPSTPESFPPGRAVLLEPVLALQLQRCCERPITFSYRCGVESDKELKEQFALLLCSRSLQWENVFIEGRPKTFALLGRYRGLFPSLKALHVGFLRHNWADDGVFSAFDELSNLERFVIAGEAQAVIQRGSKFSWQTILHYVAEYDNGWIPDLGEHYQVLPRMRNIRTCVLDTSLPDPPTTHLPIQPTLVLPFLHTLVLSQGDWLSRPAIAPLLNWLVLPALRILRLPFGFDCPTALIGFLGRSRCSLEELTILDMEDRILTGVAIDDLLRVLEVPSLQNLSTLGIGGPVSVLDDDLEDEELPSITEDGQRNATDRIFKALTIANESGINKQTLPRLSRLVLYGPRVACTEELFLEMISSRTRTSTESRSQLKYLAVLNPGAEGEYRFNVSLSDAGVNQLRDLSRVHGLVVDFLGTFHVDWSNASESPYP
ncbi:hypothetical protein PQX77_011252 [Marasmius sp. AFHP31]|nr:hypothetical protein PQX77_011252 [Marasmius sp. AFHP31]